MAKRCDRDAPGRLSYACRGGEHGRCAMSWCECPAHGRAETKPEPRPAPRREPEDQDDERDRRWWDR